MKGGGVGGGVEGWLPRIRVENRLGESNFRKHKLCFI